MKERVGASTVDGVRRPDKKARGLVGASAIRGSRENAGLAVDSAAVNGVLPPRKLKPVSTKGEVPFPKSC